MRDEDLGVHQGGGGQPGEDLLEELEEHRVAVLPRQLLVEAVLEVHGLSLVVASVEEDRPRLGNMPGEQEHDALKRLCTSVHDVSVDQVLVRLRRLPLHLQNVHEVFVLAVHIAAHVNTLAHIDLDREVSCLLSFI